MPRFLVVILLIGVFSGCSSSDKNERKMIIAVAASGQFAFNQLADEFSKEYGIEVDVITGSSGKLTTQILNGAPYDIFISANMHYPIVLKNKGKTEEDPIVYGYGVPLFWTTSSLLSFDSEMTCLLSSSVRKIAIADPRNAPYGEKAIEFLNKKGLYKKLKKKLVFGESISQVNEYILNQTVEVGITAKSIVSSRKLLGNGHYLELGEEFNIKQGMVIVKNETPIKMKKNFQDFVLSEKGTRILKSFGYAFDK